MSILIKGMKMPRDCEECVYKCYKFQDHSWYYCSLLPDEIDQGSSGAYRQDDCPMSEVIEWIPVSERLPKDPRPVLVTILWHEPYHNYEVSIAEYWDNGEGWGDWPGAEIVAWMPLPEPRRRG